MTEDQIKRAARALCRMRGLDPNERVTQKAPNGLGGFFDDVVDRGWRWEFVVSEIRAALQIQEAIKEAASEPTQDAEPAHGVVTAEEKLLRRDLREAEALLRDARGYMRLQSSGAISAFLDGIDRGRLMGRIQRFLDRKGT
jgi:hypothetical protein